MNETRIGCIKGEKVEYNNSYDSVNLSILTYSLSELLQKFSI